MGWSFDPDKIIEYCKMYLDLSKFWKNKYSDFIYQLDYDKLVLNSENEVMKLLKFCELSWDPNCLSHHKNSKAAINTVSIYQARKPIYSSSLNSSKHYEAYLNDYYKKLSTID